MAIRCRLRNRDFLLISAAALAAVTLQISAAAPTWSVGFNEPWIAQYMLGRNVSCPDCPRNMQPRSLSELQCRVLNMASQQHVGVYREIVPFKLIQPQADFNHPDNVLARELAAQVQAAAVWDDGSVAVSMQ